MAHVSSSATQVLKCELESQVAAEGAVKVERESLQPRCGTTSMFCAGAAEESGCPVRRSWAGGGSGALQRSQGSGCQLVHCYSDAVVLLDHDIPRTRAVEAVEKPAVSRRS